MPLLSFLHINHSVDFTAFGRIQSLVVPSLKASLTLFLSGAHLLAINGQQVRNLFFFRGWEVHFRKFLEAHRQSFLSQWEQDSCDHYVGVLIDRYAGLVSSELKPTRIWKEITDLTRTFGDWISIKNVGMNEILLLKFAEKTLRDFVSLSCSDRLLHPAFQNVWKCTLYFGTEWHFPGFFFHAKFSTHFTWNVESAKTPLVPAWLEEYFTLFIYIWYIFR